jgi:GNAT superfamily N-acetyltransferase
MVKPAKTGATIQTRIDRPLPRFPDPRAAPPALTPMLAAAGVRLRAAGRDDLGFLRALHRAISAPDFVLAPWGTEARERIIREQFDLQHRHFLKAFPRADYWIVERVEGDSVVPIGRYYLDRHGPVWRALEMSFLPNKRGFGVALLRWTKTLLAAAGGQGFDLHVAHSNTRARDLYLKLGFRDVDPPLDFHQRMLWLAGSADLEP